MTELAVALVRQERAVEHGAVKSHLQCATHVGQILAVIEVHADRSSGALGKSNQHRAHDVERSDLLVTLSMIDDDGVTQLLGRIDCGAGRLEARRVEGADCHVVLLCNSGDVTKVNEHGAHSFQVRRQSVPASN